MMKRLMLLIFALALLVGMGVATSAAVAGGVDGELWWRWQGWNNLDNDGDNDDAYGFAEMRARINLSGEFDGGYFTIGLQDYFDFGTWDDDAEYWHEGVEPEDVDVYEANFTLTDFLFDGFDASAGRMQLAYGRERVIGTDDWDFHHEIFFDGFKGHYVFEKGWFDLLCLKLYEGEWGKYSEGEGDIDMRGVYFHYDAMPELYVEPYILLTTMENWDEADEVDNTKMWTMGVLVDYQKDSFHFYGEGTLNSGTDEISETDISSNAFYAGLFYDFDSEYNPYIGFEYNMASGQDDSEDMTAYYAPFSSRHDFLGMMDIAEQYGETTWTDIQALRIAAGFMPVENLDVGLDYFMFTEAEVDDGDEDDIGSELDIKLNYMYSDDVHFEGGLGFFMPGDMFDDDSDNVVFAFMGTKVLF